MEKEKFSQVYPDYDLNRLPRVVRENIDEIYVEGKQKKTLLLPNGQKYYLDNKLNDLTGSEWTFFTNSVINTNYSTSGADNCAYKIRKIHPTPKPPVLLKDIISFFTKENEIVFDYFAGVGGTLLASSMCNRRAIGIELNEVYCDAYLKASASMSFEPQTMIIGDSLELINSNILKDIFNGCLAKLILIDPPYGDMMTREKTADDINKYGKNGTPFTEDSRDLGNMDPDHFWDSFYKIVSSSMDYLVDKGYLVVFIKDLQPKGKNANLLHAQMVDCLNSIDNLYYSGLKIWADQNVKLFPYGYPFSFVSNQIHQYILIFQKRIKK